MGKRSRVRRATRISMADSPIPARTRLGGSGMAVGCERGDRVVEQLGVVVLVELVVRSGSSLR